MQFTTFLLLLTVSSRGALAALACTKNKECIEALRQGSECVDGFCSNPFRTGCLRTMGISIKQPIGGQRSLSVSHTTDTNLPKRSCNSDDPDERDCEKNLDFQYPQVRIHNGNWESSIFFAWILQILLMEVLGAPATVGLTSETTSASSFYSPTNTLEYSSAAYPFSALKDARACHLHKNECAQVLPEVWNGQVNEWTKAANEGFIEPIEGNGQVGKGSWYLPRFTAERDDSLVSFYGLSGESNRRKLARTFLKPTTWLEYCEIVSTNNCSTPDATAVHFPNEGEQNKYFDAGSFKGFFRVTPENNCTINPDTCMGHIVGPGCTWSTNVDSQLYWNDIKLKPDGPVLPNGGYEYPSLIEIWRAAAATKSNLVFWWWRPEALVEEFHGTDSQFQQILLPEATDICARARVDTDARCSEDIMERRGSSEGACDQEAHALQKIVSKAFAEETLNQPLVARSPSLDLIKAVKITDLEINHMLRKWIALGVDPYGNDAREAVCGWVVENIDHLLDYIPKGYPKQLAVQSSYQSAFLRVAMAFGIFAALYILIMARLAYVWRNTKVFVYAQAHLVYLILFGFFLISIGAITTALAPSTGVCIASIWFINLGYTIELVPLLVKIAAINKILTAASKLKRVKISRQAMFRQVVIIIGFVATYLLIWTILDPSQGVEERVLSDSEGFVVETSLTCSSEKGFWTVVSFGWQTLLLFIATVLAFQSRDVAQEFNESQRLGTMIYSHMIFLVLRAVVFFLLSGRQIFKPNIISGILSLLLSFDTLSANLIYFLPKCLEAKAKPENYSNNPGIARPSAAVAAIQQKAAIAYSSYVSNTSNASIVDATGSVMPLSQSNVQSRRLKSDRWGTPGKTGQSTARPCPSVFPAFSLQHQTTNSLTELREVSHESSDNEFSSSLRKLSNIGETNEEESLVQNVSSHRLEMESGYDGNLSSFDTHAGNGSCKLDCERNSLPSQKQIIENIGFQCQNKQESSYAKALAGDTKKKTRRRSNDDSDSEVSSSSSESLDFGGPRFDNCKANADLERSVHIIGSFQ